MKKVVVCVALVAFALAPAALGGEGKGTRKTASADKAKVECTDKAGAGCADKAAVTRADKSAQSACGSSCCADGKVAKTAVKTAEKGGMLLAKR